MELLERLKQIMEKTDGITFGKYFDVNALRKWCPTLRWEDVLPESSKEKRRPNIPHNFKEELMEEIYIIANSMIVAAEPMDERDFVFGKGEAWDEEKPNRPGYRTRCVDGSILWRDKIHFEASCRKMTLKEAEMVVGGQFVIPDSSGSTVRVA